MTLEVELISTGVIVSLILWNLKISRKHCQQIDRLETRMNEHDEHL